MLSFPSPSSPSGTGLGEVEGAYVLSFPSPSSPSGTGLLGGAGRAYETFSLESKMPCLPQAKSSVKSLEPPLAQLRTRSLSLHLLKSADHTLWARTMTWTTFVAPAWTKPALGLTQYLLGAVVITLNAISDDPGLCRRTVVRISFLSSIGFGQGRGWGGQPKQLKSRGRRLGTRAGLTPRFGIAQQKVSSLSGLIWRPSAILRDTGERGTRRVAK